MYALTPLRKPAKIVIHAVLPRYIRSAVTDSDIVYRPRRTFEFIQTLRSVRGRPAEIIEYRNAIARGTCGKRVTYGNINRSCRHCVRIDIRVPRRKTVREHDTAVAPVQRPQHRCIDMHPTLAGERLRHRRSLYFMVVLLGNERRAADIGSRKHGKQRFIELNSAL